MNKLLLNIYFEKSWNPGYTLIQIKQSLSIKAISWTGEEWNLLAAGSIRDIAHEHDYRKYKKETEILGQKGLAHYFEFIPRGEIYYKVMAVCDFIVHPSMDETQSGTLARIIALNKPYITTAPLEGLTAQTLESNGGLLFTNKEMLREQVIRMACSEDLRMELGENLKHYLDEVVSWEVVAGQYARPTGFLERKNEPGRRSNSLVNFESWRMDVRQPTIL